jgi:uncharacterized membrane protein (DUF2068 family)
MKKSIRVIAILEAAKGILVLLAGFGLLGLIHCDAQRMIEELVRHFYLNPASRFPRIFVEAAAHSKDSTLWLLACAAFFYAALRLFEAFGLWRRLRWAAWLGAASGALYIPIELYELLRRVSWPNIALLLVNTACVVYLAQTLHPSGLSRDTQRSLNI